MKKNDIKLIENNDTFRLINNNFNIKPNMIIKFLKKVSINLIMGFSMNLKYIKIKLNENIIELKKISKINIVAMKDDYIEIIPNKFNTYYEVYFKIDDICSIESEMNTINLNNNINSDLYTKSHSLIELEFFQKSNDISFNEKHWKNKIKKIILITTRFIQSISDYFKIIFENKNIKCEIKYNLEIIDCLNMYNSDDIIFIILFNNSNHFLLPNKFIFYQIEQIGSVFLTDKKFKSKLKYSCLKAENVWEYTSLTRDIYKKYCENKLNYVPMPFICLNTDKYMNSTEFKYDVFFYGNKNYRRCKILNELKKHFNMKISYGIYGNEKIKYILESKIILNIHYYENSGLETCRFNEILNYNRIIISENSSDDKLNTELYNNIVILVNNVNNDLSNIDTLIDSIKYFLNNENYMKKINENKILIKKLEQEINNFF